LPNLFAAFPSHPNNSGWEHAVGYTLQRALNLLTGEPRTTAGRACLPQVAHAASCRDRYSVVHGTHQGAGTSVIYIKSLQMTRARDGDVKRVLLLRSLKAGLINEIEEGMRADNKRVRR
jgi:hypothetical protein